MWSCEANRQFTGKYMCMRILNIYTILVGIGRSVKLLVQRWPRWFGEESEKFVVIFVQCPSRELI